MKKFICSAFIGFILLSCSMAYENNLKNMGDAVKQHIRYNDEDNNIKTVVEVLKPISYEEVPTDKREQPDDAYLCKIYLKARWSYLTGSRVYNTNDTINCYFNDKMVFVRIAKQEE